MAEWLLLIGVAVLAGLVNSVASGGSLVVYPALVFVGLTPISAAATIFLALLPGNLAPIPEYLGELRRERHHLPPLLGTIAAGAVLGTVLLLLTGAEGFEALVPWLILMATGLFAAGPHMRHWAENHRPGAAEGIGGLVGLFVVAIYSTYFGSGSGNMFFALLTVRGFKDFLTANVVKNVIMAMTSLIGVVVYVSAGLITWSPVVPVLLGSTFGGLIGARGARHVPIVALRLVVIGFGLTAAGYQFLR